MFYGGVSIDEIDFDKEFDRELQALKDRVAYIESRKSVNNRYWAMKMAKANRCLEEAEISLS